MSKYNLYALAQGGLRAYPLQRRINSGETLFAWVAQPFRLDYARNKVLNVCNPGLINPWLRFPAGIDDVGLRQYLRAHRVRYVLFQFDGPGLVHDAELRSWLRFKYPVHRKIGGLQPVSPGRAAENFRNQPNPVSRWRNPAF